LSLNMRDTMAYRFIEWLGLGEKGLCASCTVQHCVNSACSKSSRWHMALCVVGFECKSCCRQTWKSAAHTVKWHTHSTKYSWSKRTFHSSSLHKQLRIKVSEDYSYKCVCVYIFGGVYILYCTMCAYLLHAVCQMSIEYIPRMIVRYSRTLFVILISMQHVCLLMVEFAFSDIHESVAE